MLRVGVHHLMCDPNIAFIPGRLAWIDNMIREESR